MSTGITGLVAFGFMLLVTALSVGRIAPASWAAAGMLALEIAVIVVFTVAAFAHPVAGAGAAFTAPVEPGGGALGAAALLAGVAPALFAFNGYDWPLYFAEETPPCPAAGAAPGGPALRGAGGRARGPGRGRGDRCGR